MKFSKTTIVAAASAAVSMFAVSSISNVGVAAEHCPTCTVDRSADIVVVYGKCESSPCPTTCTEPGCFLDRTPDNTCGSGTSGGGSGTSGDSSCMGYATNPDFFFDKNGLKLSADPTTKIIEPTTGSCPNEVYVACYKCGCVLDCIVDDAILPSPLSAATKRDIADFITPPESIPGAVDADGNLDPTDDVDFCFERVDGVNQGDCSEFQDNKCRVYETGGQQDCQTTVVGFTSEEGCCLLDAPDGILGKDCPVEGNEFTNDEISGDSCTVSGVSKFVEYKITLSGCPHTMDDPHFQTFGGQHYDFQGACDVVMVDNAGYKDGKGLFIHGRLKMYDSVRSSLGGAAIKIGDDILEVHGEDLALINGIEFPVNQVAGTEYLFPVKVGGFDLTVQTFGPNSRAHIVHMGNGEKIIINNFKEFVNIFLEKPKSVDFALARGMWGSYGEHGAMMARDGKTIIDDGDAMGFEWQVGPSDPQLFHVLEGPQYPAKCVLPDESTAEQRHLRAMSKKVSEEDAKKACADAHVSQKENCVAEVFGSDNLEMAQLFKHM